MKKIFILGLVFLSIFLFGCVEEAPKEKPLEKPPANVSLNITPTNVSQPNDTRMKLIDAHILISCTNDSDCSVIEQRLLSEMDKEGVERAVIEDDFRTTPEVDTMLLRIAERHPGRFIPFFSGFKPNDSSSIAYVKSQLDTGRWKGIGKIIFRHSGMKDSYSPNHSVMHEIYKLADQYDKPVHFHTEPAAHPDGCKAGVKELTDVLERHTNVTFIWHQGQSMSEGLDAVAGCVLSIENYSNLVAEQELHHANMSLAGYAFNPVLVQERRIVIGSDLILPKKLAASPGPLRTAGGATYHETIENTRKVLAQYSNETAKDIGYNNILRIIGEK